MENAIGTPDGAADCFRVPDVTALERDRVAVVLEQPPQVVLGSAAGEIVEHDDGRPVPGQSRRQVRADEARPADDDRAGRAGPEWPAAGHRASPRSASSAAAASTRSSAVWVRNHSASSATPSSSVTRGSKPSSSRAFEMSAKQWRMSPTRYLPVTSGAISVPSTDARLRATSLTLTLTPLPT